MLQICLFGSLRLATVGEAFVAPLGRSASLLAYLALARGRMFNRCDLLAALWCEGEASLSAGSFNTALWRLRKLLDTAPLHHAGSIVSDRRGAIGLSAGADIWLDVEEFERLVSDPLAKPLEALRQSDIDDLRNGVALYKSDILGDFEDEWALREREKHRRHYLNAQWRLLQVWSLRMCYGEAIEHAQAILDCDALREDVHRELMRLYVANGQRAQALRQFETCRDLLKRELAIQPMRETMALYQQIADGAIHACERSGDAGVTDTSRMQVHVEMGHRSAQTLGDPASQRTDCIQQARRYLAAADAQLHLSLQGA